MIDEKSKIHFLNKILSSPGFCKTNRYKELLKYLVHAEIDGKSVKETSIAIDLFNKDDSFDPAEDTIVRVSVLNIRKKLAHYYFTDGATDTVRIDIPKGTYNVIFNQIKHPRKITWNKRRKYLFSFQVLLLFFFILCAAYLYTENGSLKSQFYPVKKDNPIWYEFINSEVPTSLVLGDCFFMYEILDNRRIFIRDPRVNNINEFDEKIRPVNNDWNPLEFTYLTSSMATGTLKLIRILNIRNQETQIKLASELEWNDFNQANIIYTGHFKTMFLINRLSPQFHFQVQNDSAYVLHRLDNAGDVIESFELPRSNDQGTFTTDYSFIGKTKGPGNNTVILIASGEEVGIAQSIKMLSSPGFQDDLEAQYGEISIKDPFYFEMILKTEGFRQTGFNSEIVYYKNTSKPE